MNKKKPQVDDVEVNLETEKEKIKLNSFYSTAYTALYENCMELDKQILTLSVAGIGLLVTFFSNKITSPSIFVIWLIAIIAFILCVIIVLYLFWHNQNAILATVKDKEYPTAEITDAVLRILFVLGIIFSFIISIQTTDYKITIINKKQVIETPAEENNYVKQ